jgi:hypothetical protein
MLAISDIVQRYGIIHGTLQQWIDERWGKDDGRTGRL